MNRTADYLMLLAADGQFFYGTADAQSFVGGEGIDTVSYENAAAGVVVNLQAPALNTGDAKGDTYTSIENLIGSAHEDTLIGNELGNRLYGGGSRDKLEGGEGNDTLDGGTGGDVMDGGAGNDLFYVDTSIDAIFEAQAASEGIDTAIVSAERFELDDWVGVEILQAHAEIGHGVELAGNNYANTIVGSAYDDRLFGKGGADDIAGGEGRDALDGGEGADKLTGGAGNDTLNGGSGGDRLAGGAGDDIYYVDDANDAVVETAADGNGSDLVYTTVSYALSGYVEKLVATGAGALTLIGNDLDNTLVGNAAANVLNGGTGNDTLEGGAGGDRMEGGSGNDVYYVDNAADAIVESAGGGTDLVYATVSHTLAAHVEQLIAQGSGALTLVGNTLGNTLVGNEGNNTLKGGSGHDVLNGGYGKDVLYGGSGKDKFVFSDQLSKARNLDTIKDFKVKDDTIQLENAIFKKLTKTGTLKKSYFTIGTKAKDKNDYVIYDKKKGILYYDADGSGKGKAEEIAKLSKNLKMTYKDFYII